VVQKLFDVQPALAPSEHDGGYDELDLLRQAEELSRLVARHESAMPPGAAQRIQIGETLRSGEEECPCGSGRPFSVCHGVDDPEETRPELSGNGHGEADEPEPQAAAAPVDAG